LDSPVERRVELLEVEVRLDCPVGSLVHHCSFLCLRLSIVPSSPMGNSLV
jgi:hypothetical protein